MAKPLVSDELWELVSPANGLPRNFRISSIATANELEAA